MMEKCNIRAFEKDVTEETGWTESFRHAVKELEKQGGGMLYVPPGEYRTCSIRLKSHINFHLEQGAVLRFLDEESRYEVVDTEFEGIRGKMYMPCIYAFDAEDVAVTGNGTIDGQGFRWWKQKNMLPFARPYLICFERCSHVRIEGVRLINSPSWTVHPLYCDDVRICGVTIQNPADSPNTDGIDPDCSRNVRISDCLIDVGDDCIAIKAGTEDTAGRMPCENLVITNCNMVHGHGGIVIGSEMSGGVRNVTVSNCVFQDTDRGIRLKTRRRRGGAMERLVFQNIVMDRVLCPFIFNMYYNCGKNGNEPYVWEKGSYPADETTPGIRDILIQNVLVSNARAAAGFFWGLPEAPIERVTIANTTIVMDPDGEPGLPAMMKDLEPMKGEGFYLRNVKNLQLSQVSVEGSRGEIVNADETVSVQWNRFS
ncbi:MAG: glycoside hydrolase family 28 protein [Candidatus Limivivens sp.]|nr:glycoside hydrolase family 28 protein [Candidatus Limivivens sp.]